MTLKGIGKKGAVVIFKLINNMQFTEEGKLIVPVLPSSNDKYNTLTLEDDEAAHLYFQLRNHLQSINHPALQYEKEKKKNGKKG